jgi:hypothetical protein
MKWSKVERRTRSSRDFDMILQNAEGIKNKFTFLTLRYSKQRDSRGTRNFCNAINTDLTPCGNIGASYRGLRVAYQIDCLKKD